jgi:4a-hydroxytetrahydrobiopterin dehydratase
MNRRWLVVDINRLAASQRAEAAAHISGLDGALMTLTEGLVTDWLTAVAREHGAIADRTHAQEVQPAIATQPDAIDVGIWRAVLGYAELAEGQRPRGMG